MNNKTFYLISIDSQFSSLISGAISDSEFDRVIEEKLNKTEEQLSDTMFELNLSLEELKR
jgi:hypothetical protein